MTKVFSVLTFVAAVIFAISPFLTDGFRGFTANQFPFPQTNPPVQPAGYAFSIWGVLYIWLIISTAYGLLKKSNSESWINARPALFVSLAVGASWIAIAQVSVVWATVLIWVMLVFALAALLKSGSDDRWLLRESIGAYAGWLTAASCVALGLVIAGYGYTSQTTAAFIGLGLALIIAAAIQKARPDTVSYPLVVIWALAGVIFSNLEPLNTGVIVLCGVGIAYLARAVVAPKLR